MKLKKNKYVAVPSWARKDFRRLYCEIIEQIELLCHNVNKLLLFGDRYKYFYPRLENYLAVPECLRTIRHMGLREIL